MAPHMMARSTVVTSYRYDI